MRKLLLAVLVFCFGLLACQKKIVKPKPVPAKKEVKKIVPVKVKQPEKPKRVLAYVKKMHIPRIEKRSRVVKVQIWGMRPELNYKKQEVEIAPMETGYAVKIWLHLGKEPAKELSFFKEVSFTINKSGGHDVEVIGRKNRLVDIVFIDAF